MNERVKQLIKNTFIGKCAKSIVINYNAKKHQRYHDGEVAKMRKYGTEALDAFDKCMKQYHYSYSLATGTLLGAIREGGFIPHDEDIDVFMWIEDFDSNLYNKLSDAGFSLNHSFSIDNDKYGKEDSFLYKGVQIDIFYIYPPIDEYPYFTAYFSQRGCSSLKESIKKFGGALPKRFNIPITKDLENVPFEGLSLPVPKNAKSVLEFRYGSDYMIPNAKWNAAESNQNVIEWPEKLGIVKFFINKNKHTGNRIL